MNCDAFKDQLVELAMGTLDAAQRAEVLAHLKSGCAECNSFLAETRETVAAIPLGLELIEPPAAARDRLMKRVNDDSKPTPNPMRIAPPTTPSRWRFGIFQALAGGAIAAIIVGGIFWLPSENQSSSIATLQAKLDQTRAALDQTRATLDQTRTAFDQFQKNVQLKTDQLALNLQQANETILRTSETVEMMRSPGVQMVSLQGTEFQPKIKARAYWNVDKSMVHLYATDIANAEAGKTYQFWMITDKGAAMPSSTFAADQVANGVALALPTTADKIVAFAVTQEPMGGSKNPTMPIMIKGAIQ